MPEIITLGDAYQTHGRRATLCALVGSALCSGGFYQF